MQKNPLTVEEQMKAVLTGDTLASALDFAEYLNANGFTVKEAEVSYKGKAVCYMHLDSGDEYPGPWTIWSEGDYSSEDAMPDDGMKEIAWANVNICGSCGGSCSPGKRTTIFGREFDGVCNAAMAFYKPSGETLECVKKLLEIRKMEV